MVTIGFHAAHELYPPGELLRHVQLAERAGFASAMCSDHFPHGPSARARAASPGPGWAFRSSSPETSEI